MHGREPPNLCLYFRQRPASTNKVLVGVRVLAGVRLGVIQLACADLQQARIKGHVAGFTEVEWATHQLHNMTAAIWGAFAMADVPF